jgi:hypothetical protein
VVACNDYRTAHREILSANHIETAIYPEKEGAEKL